MKEDTGVETIDWVMGLFEEIEEPTFFDEARAISLLSAEIDSWKNKR